jgi:molybdopterin converting factor small subunit
VKYFGVIREIAGKREETLEVSASVTVLDLLRTLALKYGSNMESYLFDPNAITPRPIHLYLLNGETLTAGQTSTAMVDEGTVVSIIPTQGG